MYILTELINFIKGLLRNKQIIYDLAKRDFQSQYMGSLLGVLWIYIQPLTFIGVLYIVFTYGLRRPESDVPYAAWLISGMIPWLFFASNFSSGVDIIKQHVYLVKKTNFQLNILPIVKLLSSYLPHLVLMITALIITLSSGVPLTPYVFQLFYYLLAMSFLLIGLNWLTSSTNIFVSDVSKLVALMVQFGFWLTPVIWNSNRIPEKYQWLLNLNPMTYIVNGYRDSILNHIGFWEKVPETIYFWIISCVLCITGALVYKRLRPHFAEVV